MIDLCKYLLTLSVRECWSLFFIFFGWAICIGLALSSLGRRSTVRVK